MDAEWEGDAQKQLSPLFWLYYLLRSAGGILLSLIRRDWAQAAHYKYALQGRWYGWRKG
jgi:hypothetical protein